MPSVSGRRRAFDGGNGFRFRSCRPKRETFIFSNLNLGQDTRAGKDQGSVCLGMDWSREFLRMGLGRKRYCPLAILT